MVKVKMNIINILVGLEFFLMLVVKVIVMFGEVF